MKVVMIHILVGLCLLNGFCVAQEVDEGFMREWLVVGPFPNPPNKPAKDGKTAIYDHTEPAVGLDTDYLAEHGGEGKITPIEGMTHTKKDGSKVAWSKHVSPVDKVIFRKAITKQPNVVGYAFTTITSTNDNDYLMSLGSDEGVCVWVNGDQVHYNLIRRSIRAHDDLIPIALRKGENQILVKVEQGSGGWGFIMKLHSADKVLATFRKDMERLVTVVTLTKLKSADTQSVVLRYGDTDVAAGMFEAQGTKRLAMSQVEVPFPPIGQEYKSLSVVIDGKQSDSIAPPPLGKDRWAAFASHRLRGYPSCVFEGEALPVIDFQRPFWVERLIGSYTLKVDVYDATYRPVKTANKPARYGAVVEVKTSAGTSHEYVTLFRTEKKADWWAKDWDLQPFVLPEGLGIQDEVTVAQSKTLSNFLRWRFIADMPNSQNSAILLAGLYETSPSDPPAVYRTNVWERNRRWWVKLRDQLGLFSFRYLVNLPTGYKEDTTKNWPLLIFLHGSGERGTNPEVIRRHGPAGQIAKGMELPFIVISPQCPPNERWRGSELSVFMDKMIPKYRVDRDRIYCTGLSLGGFGTWALATERPDLFAAIAPICGGGDPSDAGRIKDIPAKIFHGATDTVVLPEESQKMVDAIKELGGKPIFTLYENVGHNSWGRAYNEPDFYTWLLKQKRSDH